MDYLLYFFGWFFLLVVLNVADAILTVRILGGGGRELNPFMAAAMRVVGVKPALLLIKAAGLGVAFGALYGAAYSAHVMAGMCLIYVFVVWHNWRQYAAQAK